MSIYVSTLLVFFVAIKDGYTAPPSTFKSDKPLFLASLSYPTMVQPSSNIYGTGRLENAAYYYPYGTNPGYNEYSDLLQRSPSNSPFERVLQNILHHRGENRKSSENVKAIDEEDYRHKANNILSNEQLIPELEDLDRRYKRSTDYNSWDSPTKFTANFENRMLPTGPGIGWPRYLPMGDPNVHSYLRSGRKDDSNNDRNRKNEVSVVPAQYAPAFNTYAMLPSSSEIYRLRFNRDLSPSPFIYDLPYRTLDNPAVLTNSLLASSVSSAFAEASDPAILKTFHD